ncbi:MAG TPA: hypothetical protein PLI62_16115, partial [Spirochaetota bacterium]|nr:hypothetical protein [Spirochaetota bacterium]
RIIRNIKNGIIVNNVSAFVIKGIFHVRSPLSAAVILPAEGMGRRCFVPLHCVAPYSRLRQRLVFLISLKLATKKAFGVGKSWSQPGNKLFHEGKNIDFFTIIVNKSDVDIGRKNG